MRELRYREEVEPRMAGAARERVRDFQEAGIQGVDLYLARFGPVLARRSRQEPLERGTSRAPLGEPGG